MHYITVEKDVQLAVQEYNPGGEHTLLMVHGWPLSNKIFEYQCNVLPQYNIHAVTYDLRGYGASDVPYYGYGYDRMADDLYKVIQSIDCKSLTLLGFSMGGAVVTRYMARHKGYKVEKLILAGAAVPSFVKRKGFPYGMTVEAVNQLIQQSMTDRNAMVDSFGKLCFATNVSESYRNYFSQIGYSASGIATIKGLEALRDESLFEDLGKIYVPTMILHGKRDKVCPFALAEVMHKSIPGSFIVPLERSSHALFFEEKEKFTASLLDFIAGKRHPRMPETPRYGRNTRQRRR